MKAHTFRESGGDRRAPLTDHMHLMTQRCLCVGQVDQMSLAAVEARGEHEVTDAQTMHGREPCQSAGCVAARTRTRKEIFVIGPANPRDVKTCLPYSGNTVFGLCRTKPRQKVMELNQQLRHTR